MSILIKGMDKPTDCGLCPFEDFGYCNVKGERNTSEEGIDADCPLIEVADRKTEPQYHADVECNYKDCDNCGHKEYCPQRKIENSSEIPNNFAKDINVRSKDEQTDCNGCKFVGTYDTEFPCANCSRKTKDYYAKEEPTAQEYEKWLFKEPQTERSN